jgi:hypothetical protein
MVYSFARVSAVTGMRRSDYFSQGRRGWLQLHEKGGKRHDVPAHHLAESYLDAYLDAAGVADPKAPPLSECRSRPSADRESDRATGGVGDGETAGGGRGSAGRNVLSHVSRHRHHRVSLERRHRSKFVNAAPKVREIRFECRSTAGRPPPPGQYAFSV